ncbi:acyl carrier protein [Streptomyces sp. 7R007]
MREVSVPEAIAMLHEVVNVPDIHADTEFGSLGLDSLKSIEWLSMIEDRVGFEFDLQQLNFHAFGRMSIGEVVDALHQQVAAATGS